MKLASLILLSSSVKGAHGTERSIGFSDSLRSDPIFFGLPSSESSSEKYCLIPFRSDGNPTELSKKWCLQIEDLKLSTLTYFQDVKSPKWRCEGCLTIITQQILLLSYNLSYICDPLAGSVENSKIFQNLALENDVTCSSNPQFA